MKLIGSVTTFVLLVGLSACRAEEMPAALPDGVQLYDLSEPDNLYEQGRSGEALRSIEAGDFPREVKDDLLLRMMVADRVVGRDVKGQLFHDVLKRVALSQASGKPTSRERYLLAVALSQEGEVAHAGDELRSICAGIPSEAIQCHERELEILKENAMLASSVLDSRLLRGVSLLLKREAVDGPQVEASQIYGLYFDNPVAARGLYQGAIYEESAKEAFCSAVHSTPDASISDMSICR